MPRVDFGAGHSELPPRCQAPQDKPPQRRRHAALVRRCVTLVVALLLASTVSVGPAWAHGADGGAEEGYVFVQQALGHLARDPGPKGVAAAQAKIQETLSAADQDGVDVALVRQAEAELTAGRTQEAQQTLQQSIADAVGALKAASGEQTGTTVVGTPLPGRGSLTGTDWALGVVSLLLLLAGVGFALWFRPAQNLAQLRRGLTATPVTGMDPATDPPSSPTDPAGGQPS
jgi:hypothetical protein